MHFFWNAIFMRAFSLNYSERSREALSLIIGQNIISAV